MQRETEKGNTLLELVVVLAIVAVVTSMACDLLIRTARRVALRTAAIKLEQVMIGVRHDASGTSAQRGLRFARNASGWEYAIYEDTDGDGVLNADILAGIDVRIEGPFPLSDRLSVATIGVPEAPVTHPDTGDPFSPSARAINFNQSSICSFSPNGDATPGTIYLVNGTRGEAAMVRSSGEGGRIRALFFGLRGSGWQP